MDAATAAAIQADWYKVLQKHSAQTIDRVAIEWLTIGKHKPTPANILQLCNETDDIPNQIDRFRKMYELPVKDPVENSYVDDGKMNGCPIFLAKLMRYATANGIPFSNNEQLEYLSTGRNPSWYIETDLGPRDKTDLPTREELLATMPPEVRSQAIKDRDDWKAAR